MNWLNLNVQTLDSERFLGADPVERATWLCLLRYCIGQENNGMIFDCEDWADRKWQQLVRITKKEANKATLLWRWESGSLHVWGYPSEKEQEVKEKRERAKTNGEKGGRPKITNVESQKEPTLVISAKAEGEREVEGERNENKNLPPYPAAVPPVNGKIREGKSADRVPTSPQAVRFATIVHRKLTTPWQDNEIAAYKKIGIVPEDDLAALERYYGANWPPKRDVNILRHDLLTLLNNLAGEIDRAHAEKHKPKNGKGLEWAPAVAAPPTDPAEAERIASAARQAAREFRESQGR